MVRDHQAAHQQCHSLPGHATCTTSSCRLFLRAACWLFIATPPDVFLARMQQLQVWILARPEQSIALVSHWGVLQALTGGHDFENCELQTLAASQLQQLDLQCPASAA